MSVRRQTQKVTRLLNNSVSFPNPNSYVNVSPFTPYIFHVPHRMIKNVMSQGRREGGD